MGIADAWSDIFYINWRIIIKLIRSKSLFLWNTFTFNVVITHGVITFQDIFIEKIPKDFTSMKDTYHATLNNRLTGIHATKPRALGLLGHSETCMEFYSLGNLFYYLKPNNSPYCIYQRSFRAFEWQNRFVGSVLTEPYTKLVSYLVAYLQLVFSVPSFIKYSRSSYCHVLSLPHV